MTVAALIKQVGADGMRLWVDGEGLAYEGPADVVERWIPRIVASKPEIMAALTAPISTWWLIHYQDREPVQVRSAPPATEAEILERRPDAIAAQPLHQAAQTPISACVTCVHVTGRGSCGEPVAAGLSDVVGVIVYHDGDGKDCPAWMEGIPSYLEARILAMAERGQYSGDDLALVLAGARSAPDGWRKVVEADEQIGGEIYGG